VDRARRRGGLLLWSIAAAVLVVDRLTKLWAEHALTQPRDLIDGVVTLRFTTNSGGAFSLGDRAPLVFAIAAIVVCGAIVATSFRARPMLQAVAFGLILGGATGNLLDRILRGRILRARGRRHREDDGNGESADQAGACAHLKTCLMRKSRAYERSSFRDRIHEI